MNYLNSSIKSLPHLCLGLLCLLLTACQTIQDQNLQQEKQANDSVALRVVKAAGVSKGLRDVSKAEIDTSIKEESNTDMADLGFALAHSQDLLSPPSGISNWGAASIYLLSVFSSPTVQEYEKSKLLVWLPATQVKDSLEAQAKMGRVLENAAIAALPDGYSSKLVEWTDTAIFGANSVHRVIKVDGPICPEWSCVIKGTFPSEEKFGYLGKMKKVKTPSFIQNSSEESYTYSRSAWVMIYKITKEYDEEGRGKGRWHRIETEPLEGFNHTQWFIALSKHLPNWAYYYHAPFRKNEKYSFFSVPLVLSSGKANYFISPEITPLKSVAAKE